MRRLKANLSKAGKVGVLPVLLSLILPHILLAQPIIQHHLRIVLQPDQHRLQATDTISIPKDMGNTLEFRLHAGLQLTTSTPGVQLTPRPMTPQRLPGAMPTTSYTVTLPPDRHTFVLHYTGQIVPPLQRNSNQTRNVHGVAGATVFDRTWDGTCSRAYATAARRTRSDGDASAPGEMSSSVSASSCNSSRHRSQPST